MTPVLDNLLWRFGCGLMSRDEFIAELDRVRRQLVDQREELAGRTPASHAARGPWFKLLDDLESTVQTARLEIDGGAYRRAIRALRHAEVTLDRALQTVEASTDRSSASHAWRDLVVRFDLEPLSDLATPSIIERTLRVADRFLAEGRPTEAKVVACVARRMIDALAHRDDDAHRSRALRERTTKLDHGETSSSLRRRVEGLLDECHLELAERLLDDWHLVWQSQSEPGADPVVEVEERLPGGSRFRAILEDAEHLESQLGRSSEGGTSS